eukprot:469952-Pyramimonas_sp.AAC.2
MHENIRHCGTHKARSAWIRAPLLHSAGITMPPMTTAPGGLCLDCVKPLLRDPYGQCLACERGVHLACLAEKLDPTLLFEEDPYSLHRLHALLHRGFRRSRGLLGLGPPQAGVDARHRGGVGFQQQPRRVSRLRSAGDRHPACGSPPRPA